MSRVVQVPLLVSHCVALAEHREEKVPIPIRQQIGIKLALGFYAVQQAVQQRGIFFGCAQRRFPMGVVIRCPFPDGVGIHAEYPM